MKAESVLTETKSYFGEVFDWFVIIVRYSYCTVGTTNVSRIRQDLLGRSGTETTGKK